MGAQIKGDASATSEVFGGLIKVFLANYRSCKKNAENQPGNGNKNKFQTYQIIIYQLFKYNQSALNSISCKMFTRIVVLFKTGYF